MLGGHWTGECDPPSDTNRRWALHAARRERTHQINRRTHSRVNGGLGACQCQTAAAP